MIWRNPSKSGNIATTLGIKGPGFSASRWETKGWFWHFRGDVTVIRPLKCQNQPFVSHLLAENPGPLIPSVVAILPDFDGFLQITSKLDYLYRSSRNPKPTMPVLTLCLHLLAEDPRHLIQSVMAILPVSKDFFQFNQNSTIYTDLIVIRHLNAKINPLSPTCSLRTRDPRLPIVVAICQISMDFFKSRQNSTIYTDLAVIWHLQCPS